MKPRVIAVALILAGAVHLGASAPDTRAPATSDGLPQPHLTAAATTPPASLPHVGRLPTAAPAPPFPAFAASTPFAVVEVASLPRQVASLPLREPQATAVPRSTAPPTPDRTGCDPAYPDARTCIPPGPPINQGCAITDERRFTVLPPDPQRLDHDKDGIGCEPIR